MRRPSVLTQCFPHQRAHYAVVVANTTNKKTNILITRGANTVVTDSVEAAYLSWFMCQGLPRGKLGEQMALVLEIKTNGLEKSVATALASTR